MADAGTRIDGDIAFERIFPILRVFDEAKARAAGFDRWLAKPYDDDALDAVLDAAAAR